MIISIIAAMAENRIIGNKNSLPWNLPADMKRFQELTMGKPIIMGFRTFESIGSKALFGRKNIILTEDKNYKANESFVANSIEEALKLAEGAEEIMICGGASVYKQFLPLADKMYLTLIHQDFEGDSFFPEFIESDWKETQRQDFSPDEKNHFAYSFLTFEKIRK